MAEGSVTSAIGSSELEQNSPSQSRQMKRQQSPSEQNNSKRRRLSANEPVEPRSNKSFPAPPPKTTDQTTDSINGKSESRRKSGKEEERKRGQRLFGALLGTLSQSSSSTAQRRRSEIERKQQAKLKQQDLERNELTKRKKEDLLAARRRDQKLYDEESMNVRHSNMLAMAHFLKTKAEPALYYKPWKLQSQDESKVQIQVKNAHTAIETEAAGFDQQRRLTETETQADVSVQKQSNSAPRTAETVTKDPSEAIQTMDTVGANTNNKEQAIEPPKSIYPTATASNTNHPTTTLNPLDPSINTSFKTHEDDSGEVILEDKEDTVIY